MSGSPWAAAAVFFVALIGAAVSPNVADAQASFDCRRASHPSEIAVCRDPELATVDRNLDAAFRAALNRSADPESLRAGQRVWLADLRNCNDDPFCLYETYADRIDALKNDRVEGGRSPAPQTAATADLSSAGGSDVLPLGAEEPSPAEEAAAAQPTTTADTRYENPSAAPAVVEPERPQRQGQTEGSGELFGGAVILGLLVVLLLALLATKALADHSMRKFGWPMILNWWNVLHLVVGFALWGGGMIGAPLGGMVVAGGVWLIVLAVNIRKTDVVTGLAMTVVQPFVVAILFVVFQFSRNKSKPYDYISRS